MKRSLSVLATLAVLLSPLAVTADVVNIITLQLQEECTLEQLQGIADEINALAGDRAKGELMLPYYGDDQGVVFAVVRSPTFAAWGAWADEIRAGQMQADSAIGKLFKRAQDCATLQGRTAVVTVK